MDYVGRGHGHPEIERVFRFRVTRMERYLVARYDGETGGFFRPQRDNEGDGHREFAVSLNLNADDYEGGDLRFPEYGLQTYRPPTGEACIFSCGLVHEATPLTRGHRYAFLPLLYDEATARRCEAANVGSALSCVLKTAWKVRSGVRVQASLPTLADVDPKSLPSSDAVIVDAPVLRNDLAATMRQLRSAVQAPVVIVVYSFGNRQILSQLDNSNAIALASPADPAQIARICQLGLSMDPTPPAAFSQMLMHSAAARRCDDTFLQQLSQMPSKVQCECPNHLADLLRKLKAFESYSLECESTSNKDAAMHAMMYSASGHCRKLLEEVLRRLMAHEGIPEPEA